MSFIDPEVIATKYDDFVRFLCYDSDHGGQTTELCRLAKSFHDVEERLFFVFLVTHFDNAESARDLRKVLSWESIKGGVDIQAAHAVDEFFHTKRLIGDHRRRFMCTKDKSQFTIHVLREYVRGITPISQSIFFELGSRPLFENLFQKLSPIFSGRRLPTWDHLERLGAVFNWYFAPPIRLFLEIPTHSGPFKGLMYMLFDSRSAPTRKSMSDASMVALWNTAVPSFPLPDNPKMKQVIPIFERWLISSLKEDARVCQVAKEPAFPFRVESALCNWQKGK